MNDKVEIHTEKQLESMTLKAITEYNSMLCSKAGLKSTKRFSTKPKAIARTLENVLAYKKWATKAERPAGKSKKIVKKTIKKFELDTVFELGTNVPKEGTAMGITVAPVKKTGSKATAETIMKYVVKHLQQPRGNSVVDMGFARSCITCCLRNKHLKIVK